MQMIRIILVCIAAAMVCAAIRLERPELATGISLAVGMAVLLSVGSGAEQAGRLAEYLKKLANMDGDLFGNILKAAGIAVISEMGAQICMDAGERALAGRIALASRVTMLWLCMPMVEKMLNYLDSAY